MLQMLVKAILDLIDTGGRVSDEVWEWLQKVITEDVDEAQEIAIRAAATLEEKLATRLDELESRLKALESPSESETKPTAKRGTK